MKTRIEVQKNQIFAGIEEYLLMIDLYTDVTNPSIISSIFLLLKFDFKFLVQNRLTWLFHTDFLLGKEVVRVRSRLVRFWSKIYNFLDKGGKGLKTLQSDCINTSARKVEMPARSTYGGYLYLKKVRARLLDSRKK